MAGAVTAPAVVVAEDSLVIRAVTSRVTTEDVVEGLRLGAHDYLRKPFEPSELLARVHAAVRSKALQDELRLRNAELELASRTDALTGLSNRRHLEEQLSG
jgi:PleD family two-component response regulator